ncbi:MAG: extracellular solute-binding protein [Bacillota bacterium]|jgi:molybdate/tungstate transport system substrate-binding protein
MREGQKGLLKILHAGALRKPMKEIVHLFREQYPGVEVRLDYSGSRACAQAVLAGQDADVIALADPHVFEDLLVPGHVDVFFVFATDQMVLAYDEFSFYSSKINQDNWPDILLRDQVNFARSDHNLDPCGYRTLMVWRLAEKYYNKHDLFNRLNEKCGPGHIYHKSIDLCDALLEGRADYAFIYSSEAQQFNFEHIKLPGKINLSSPVHAGYYAGAEVAVTNNNGSVSLVRGSPIEFAVAIPKNSANKDLAREFLNILTSVKGEQVLEECGLIPC